MTSHEDNRKYRLGAVSYLNAKPLIQGLDAEPRIELVLDVPARLPAMLDSGEADCGLIPVIDVLQRDQSWRILSDACIGCDGETLTVRVFSRMPAEEVGCLHVDGDSHTSVALARIIWREHFGRELIVTPFTGAERVDECEAVLLIGDKVVNHTLLDHEIETDLGACWKSLTGLPFVFAVWAAPVGDELEWLAGRLSKARDAGVASAEMIAADYGPALGWPVAMAKRYLSQRLKFTLGPRQREGMARFVELVKKHDIVRTTGELVFE